MVKNTQYRLFTAYSDPEAKEVGTIYQACNFYYLGATHGSSKYYLNPYTNKIVSDRFFRQSSAYKRYAKELCILWKNQWDTPDGKIAWDNIPKDVALKLKTYAKIKQDKATQIHIDKPAKGKYAYVQGSCKGETKQLRKLFEALNKTYPYPKRA